MHLIHFQQSFRLALYNVAWPPQWYRPTIRTRDRPDRGPTFQRRKIGPECIASGLPAIQTLWLEQWGDSRPHCRSTLSGRTHGSMSATRRLDSAVQGRNSQAATKSSGGVCHLSRLHHPAGNLAVAPVIAQGPLPPLPTGCGCTARGRHLQGAVALVPASAPRSLERESAPFPVRLGGSVSCGASVR